MQIVTKNQQPPIKYLFEVNNNSEKEKKNQMECNKKNFFKLKKQNKIKR